MSRGPGAFGVSVRSLPLADFHQNATKARVIRVIAIKRDVFMRFIRV
jgi:hypothetical protein